MKKIQFYKLGTLRSDWMLLIPFILIPIGFIMDSRFGSVLVSIGFLAGSIHLVRPFIFENYVAWNKRAMQIKFNKVYFNLVSFKSIDDFKLENKTLTISSENKLLEYNVSQVRDEDLNKLVEILKSNTNKFASKHI